MVHPQSPTPTRYRQLPGAVVLVLALLWAQLLGLAHGVMHAQGRQAPVSAVTAHAAHAHAEHGLLAHLLAPADETGECRLYDQLGLDGPVSPQHIALSLALPLLPAWVVLQALQPSPCVAFAARAPPASR
ncbi:MAG: hypothetical protein Q8R72_05820 [Hylemonella sp.]|nr:hypothetical protein [Hylemonella sp.]